MHLARKLHKDKNFAHHFKTILGPLKTYSRRLMKANTEWLAETKDEE